MYFFDWIYEESSPQLIRKTLCKAEDTAKFAAQLAVPVIHSLERPIHVVDALACKTLDKMEDSLPAMTQTPEQVHNSFQLKAVVYSIARITIIIGRIADYREDELLR